MVDNEIHDQLQITIDRTSDDSDSDNQIKTLKTKINTLQKNIEKLRKKPDSSSSNDSSNSDSENGNEATSSKANKRLQPKGNISFKSSKVPRIEAPTANKKTQTINCTYCHKLNHVAARCRLRLKHRQRF